MIIPWFPVYLSGVLGTIITLILSIYCASQALIWKKRNSAALFPHHMFMLTSAFVLFAVFHSLGHMATYALAVFDSPGPEYQLLYQGQKGIRQLVPLFSELINSVVYIVIFTLIMFFSSFQRLYKKISIQKDRLEEEIRRRETVERKTEKAKREWEETVDAIPEMLALLDEHCNIMRANKTMAGKVGMEPGDMVGNRCCTVYSGCIESVIEECPYVQLSKGGTVVFEKYIDYLDAYLEINMIPILNRDQILRRLVYYARDITARRDAEKEKEKLQVNLLHAQKMESVGQLAAGIAHEINTPTQYISSNLDFLIDAFKDLEELIAKFEELQKSAGKEEVFDRTVKTVDDLKDEIDYEFLVKEIPQALEQSRDGAGRVSNIVRSMKEFSHPGGKEKKPEDLNKIIENTVTVSRNEWKYVAELNLDLEPEMPFVPCLRDEMGQVILNMVVNAAWAIKGEFGDNPEGEKGLISISTRLFGDRAEIRVADNGIGMSGNIMKRIFDPFFTTRTVGKGTGQGLSICHDVLVEKHGGTLSCESEAGEGSVFIIGLPL